MDNRELYYQRKKESLVTRPVELFISFCIKEKNKEKHPTSHSIWNNQKQQGSDHKMRLKFTSRFLRSFRDRIGLLSHAARQVFRQCVRHLPVIRGENCHSKELKMPKSLADIKLDTETRTCNILSRYSLNPLPFVRQPKANSAISSFILHNITSLITLASQYNFYAGGIS